MRTTSPAALFAAVAVASGAVGCAATENAAAVRGDLLRTQDELARTAADLRRLRADLAAAEREADTLRTRLAEGGADGAVLVAEAPEQARALGRVTGVTVSKLLTGGLDRDDEPGDELLAVVLAPADADGDPVKAPGAVELELLDLSAEGPGRTVGSWAFDAAAAAEAWRSTPVGTGYRFRVPLTPRPDGDAGGDEFHLVVRFETADGRRFDVTHPVRVRRAVGAAVPPPAPPPVAARVPRARPDGHAGRVSPRNRADGAEPVFGAAFEDPFGEL